MIEFPSNWSLLKIDGAICKPYYYSMAYTDDRLGYRFYLTDFQHVWSEDAYGEDIAKIAKSRNMILTEDKHIKEVIGVLNGCLFQQFYHDPLYQKEYKCDFNLHKINPYQQVDSEVYLTIKAKNGFKWDFNLKIMPPSMASDFIKKLNFNLFNMVYRMEMQSSTLVDIIGEKDKAISYLLDVVDQTYGNGLIEKFKGAENSYNSKILKSFNYNSWVKKWKVSKSQDDLNAENNDIWTVVDIVSKNPDLWEFSTHYYDSQVQSKVQKKETNKISKEDNLYNEFLQSKDESDSAPEPNVKLEDLKEEPNKAPEKAPEELKKAQVVDGTPHDMLHLSKSFHEVDIDKPKPMKLASSPTAKKAKLSVMSEKLNPSTVPLESQNTTPLPTKSKRRILGLTSSNRKRTRKGPAGTAKAPRLN